MSTFEFDDRIGGRLRGTLHVPGATPGDVVTVGANGALSPAPGGGSSPLVRIERSVVYADFIETSPGSGQALTAPIYTLQPDEQYLWSLGLVTEAFNDSGNGAVQLADAANNVAFGLGTLGPGTPNSFGAGLIALLDATQPLGDTNWGEAAGPIGVESSAVDLCATLQQYNGDGTTGAATIWIWIWRP